MMKKVYFASPFFNEEQVEREEALKQILRNNGFEVLSPKERFVCPPNASYEVRKQTFSQNIQDIIASDIVFAVTDGKDVGTIFEAGVGYMLKEVSHRERKLVYFCETLKGDKFNLMLAQSADCVVTSRQQLEKMLQENGDFVDNVYRGEIE